MSTIRRYRADLVLSAYGRNPRPRALPVVVDSAVARRLKERTLKVADAQWIEKEFMTDYPKFRSWMRRCGRIC